MPDRRLEKCRHAYENEELTKPVEKPKVGTSLLNGLDDNVKESVMALVRLHNVDENDAHQVQDIIDYVQEVLNGTGK